MEFVRDWRRQAARAAGATALAPVVLLVAAVLLAAGGGLGGLGSLGQITAGPSVPPAELAAGETNALVSASPPPSPKVASGAGETPRSTPTAPRAGDRRRGAAPAQRTEPSDGVAVRNTPTAPVQRAPSVGPTRPPVGNPQPATPPPPSASPVPQTQITPQVPVPSPGPQIVVDTKNLGPALPPFLQPPPVQIIVNLPLPLPLPLLPPR